MEILKAVILGIIQGITEFLPVSSSGHISVFTYFFGGQTQSSGLLPAMLHIGTIVAVLIYFYKPVYSLFTEFFAVFRDLFRGKLTLNFKKMSQTRRMLFYFVISCVPLLFLLIPIGDGEKILDAVGVFSTDKSILCEGICFMITGFLVVLGCTVNGNFKKHKKITGPVAFLVGIAQTLAACFPGISRSGSTISTGLCCGVSKKNMVQYSFILSIPAVLVSGLIEFKDAISVPEVIPVAPLIAGVISSAVVGLVAIRLLEWLLKKNRFKYFGFYCMALGLAVTALSVIDKF